MNSDEILLIPYLSKELNLIGHKPLPFIIQNKQKKKVKKNDFDEKAETEFTNIVFDSKKMLCALVSACSKLIKEVKILCSKGSDDELDRLNFEKCKLQNQISSCKYEIKVKNDEISAVKEQNRQLQEKLSQLENQTKTYKIECKKIVNKCKTNENLLKHNLQKQQFDTKQLHKFIWKKFNLIDPSFLPENFEIIHLQQPDFNKLWSVVKYSSPATKEDALKKAVCIFQENNNFLMEYNRYLKTLLLITLEQIHDEVKFILEKMHLSEVPLESRINEVFKNVEEIDTDLFKVIITEHFTIIKNALELFNESSFMVAENLFVCWSDITRKFKN